MKRRTVWFYIDALMAVVSVVLAVIGFRIGDVSGGWGWAASAVVWSLCFASDGPLMWPIRCPLHPKVNLDDQGECPACTAYDIELDTRARRREDM